MDIEIGNGRATDSQVLKIESRSFPEWLFEYHPVSKKVYKINVLDRKIVGEVVQDQAFLLAEDVPDGIHARNLVKAYLYGYKEGVKAKPAFIK